MPAAVEHSGLESGILHEFDWLEKMAIIRFWLAGEGCRLWWVKVGMHMYGRQFVTLIESGIRRFESSQSGIGVEARG